MGKTKTMFVCTLLLLGGAWAGAQQETKEVTIKKGEVLDILLFAGKPDFKENFKRYRETAFTFAAKTGYRSLPLFKVMETTQGGYQPSTFVFGKWTDVSARKKFLDEIVNEVPDFHEQRRTLWSSFYLAFYEMEEDVSLRFDEHKVYVATAYWQEGTTEFNTFKNKWRKQVKKGGAKILLELNDAQSSVGYMYKPDYVILTEWDNREAFRAFQNENLKMGYTGIQNVNEFIIQ